MESHHLLSPDQFQYIKSQNSDIPNKSENLKRIASKIDAAFETFDLILHSDTLPQEFKDKVFDEEKMRKFLLKFSLYNRTLPLSEESNKQKISKQMISLGLHYFEARYKETTFLNKRIGEINSLLNDIDFLTLREQQENEAMAMYRARKKLRSPPTIEPGPFWSAVCMWCFNYSLSTNKTKEDAIKNLRHEKHCTYKTENKRFGKRHKKQIDDQYLKIIPPKKK